MHEVNIIGLLCVLWNVWWNICVWDVLIAFVICDMFGGCVSTCTHIHMHRLLLWHQPLSVSAGPKRP